MAREPYAGGSIPPTDHAAEIPSSSEPLHSSTRMQANQARKLCSRGHAVRRYALWGHVWNPKPAACSTTLGFVDGLGRLVFGLGSLGSLGSLGLFAPIAADLGRDEVARVFVATLLNVDGITFCAMRIPVEPNTVHPPGGGTALATLFGLRCHALVPWDNASAGAR